MTTEPMLEACPNCGSAAEQPFIGDAVQCTNKNCLTFSPNPAAWNTRVSRTPPVDQDEVERLCAKLHVDAAMLTMRDGMPVATVDRIVEAANLIKRLASIGSGAGDVREALRPFAECVSQIKATEDDEEWAKFRLLVKDYRRAARALGITLPGFIRCATCGGEFDEAEWADAPSCPECEQPKRAALSTDTGSGG
jgi:predicted Zn-ribbon and HTH transcriptional regulator